MNYLIALISFMIGSIPFGYILVKRKTGIDIRKKGSGNIGSTNVKRVAGKKLSIIVQILDIIKGIIPVVAVLIFYNNEKILISSICAICAVLGHIYSPFMCFKGGKGINTYLGAFFLLCPISVLLSVLIHIILKKITNIVSIRSLILSVAIPIISFVLKYDLKIIIASSIVTVFIVIAHRDNIKRLINKTEN